MKDLYDEELKKDIKEKLELAVKESTSPDTTITFVFDCGNGYKPKEKIKSFAGLLKYKGVSFNVIVDGFIENHPDTIDIIVSNFHYNYFSFIETKIKRGKVECHGFGDYWGHDTITFIYRRLEQR